MVFSFDSFRAKWQVALRRAAVSSAKRVAQMAVGVLALLPAWCQYPGQVTEAAKNAAEPRAVAVLEWTGEAGHPKASRMVPVCVYDGEKLQDGGIYLARPLPMALTGEVEYELQTNGKPVGLFDIKNAGQEQGSWVGYGAWKPLPIPKPKPSMDEVARNRIEDEYSDRPILHRKHPSGEKASGGKSDSASASSSGPPLSDADRPSLHRKTSENSAGGSAPPDDPDLPVLKKNRKKSPEKITHVDSLPDATDPGRPRLKRGKSTGNGLDVLPTLMKLPADMQQAVAVSDARNRPELCGTTSGPIRTMRPG
jgi:hypothetical protein